MGWPKLRTQTLSPKHEGLNREGRELASRGDLGCGHTGRAEGRLRAWWSQNLRAGTRAGQEGAQLSSDKLSPTSL